MNLFILGQHFGGDCFFLGKKTESYNEGSTGYRESQPNQYVFFVAIVTSPRLRVIQWPNGPSKCLYGGFLTWGYPQITYVDRFFHYKPSIFGVRYPHLWRENPLTFRSAGTASTSLLSLLELPLLSLSSSPAVRLEFQPCETSKLISRVKIPAFQIMSADPQPVKYQTSVSSETSNIICGKKCSPQLLRTGG